ncbi:MAG: DNA polymerase II [Treponema sp.]|jgi:DNA polymerase-2|nr:DNA polymerase II [Treponema sp.]
MTAAEKPGVYAAYIVHGWTDIRRNRLYFAGRLEDGSSFALVEERFRPYFHVYERDRLLWEKVLSSIKYDIKYDIKYEREAIPFEDFYGKEKLSCLRFPGLAEKNAAQKLLEKQGIRSPDADLKPADVFLAERYIKGPVEIGGAPVPGRLVDRVFTNPELRAPGESPAGSGGAGGVHPADLKIASIDIETDTKSGAILAVGIAGAWGAELKEPSIKAGTGIVRVLAGEASGALRADAQAGQPTAGTNPHGQEGQGLIFHPDERSLLAAFIADIQRLDPDVLTGWNFLDFDFPQLAKRCDYYRVPFCLGRSTEAAKFFPSQGNRSAAALVPGRQVIDSLRIVRAGYRSVLYDFTLENVSQTVLGEGKIVSSSGTDKIAELEKLYREDPDTFGLYCLKDAELVLRILAATGLFRLTLERSSLTGVSLDKAWTSVASFERIYGMELRRKGICPPLPDSRLTVSGAAGGTVLDPQPGFFSNVAVFDFRSLYPTIMLTFNIDPLSHARAELQAESGNENSLAGTGGPLILAPNTAAFLRTPGVLPSLIALYFAERKRALKAGDAIASQVYKILMNSFYGVLGTRACRYGRTELAGAITSFARKWLLLSRDWFTEKGFRVLYGDTDSLFVETGLGDGSCREDFARLCGDLAGELNGFLTRRIGDDYGLESFIELRYEKTYRRFLIPPIRNNHEKIPEAIAVRNSAEQEEFFSQPSKPRGRAKGYCGYLLDDSGGASVEVKGMEAVRSDVTPLARRLQVELLELIFTSKNAEEAETRFKEKLTDTLSLLRGGKLDTELVYRKRLSRPPEAYTSSTPPQVKAARALGWKNRRGTVEYVWTLSGAEPASLPHDPLDYGHYADSQILPLALSIAAAAGWNMDAFVKNGKAKNGLKEGQLELDM